MFHKIPQVHFGGIDHGQAVVKYLNGDFNNAKLPKKRNIHLLTSGKNREIVSVHNNSENYFVVRTHEDLCQDFVRTGVFSPSGGLCPCGVKFSHRGVGVPIRRLKINKSTVLLVEGLYHSFNCALRKYMSLRDDMYKNTEQYLKNTHQLMYPDKELIPAPDFELFKANGGILEDFPFDLWLDEDITWSDIRDGVKESIYPFQIPIGIEYRSSGNTYTRLNRFSLPDVDSAVFNNLDLYNYSWV